MQKFFIFFLTILIFISSTTFAADTTRWLEVNQSADKKIAWFIDSKTLKINDNKTVTFWAKAILNSPKYDIAEIKIKYILSADHIQLTKMQEIGYSNKNEVLWNNNTTKTISIIPGSNHEKLSIFIEEYLESKEKTVQDDQKNKEQQHNDKEENSDITEKNKSENNKTDVKTVHTEIKENIPEKQKKPVEIINAKTIASGTVETVNEK